MGTGAVSFLLPHVNHLTFYGFLLLWCFAVSLSARWCDPCTALSQVVLGPIDCVMATQAQ